MAALALTACNNAAPPSPPAESEGKAVEAAEAAAKTPAVALPTAAPPTATPTQGPPTATPTKVVRPSATPTPLPSPTPAAQIYVVEKYDTLLGIAIEFDTTVEALLAANGINENDFLQIGQELIIPAPGREYPTEAAVTESVNQEDISGQVADENTAGDTAGAAGPEPPAPASASTESVDAVGDNTAKPASVTTSSAPAAPVVSPPDVSRPANINPLTGLPVDDPAALQRRPLMVRIGNDVAARASQAGLNSADIVYEEITEWWVTRFTAIFLSETPKTVGPVRSARLINAQLTPQYQAALAHSGGSDAVRWEISQAPIINLDEFYSPQPYYYRPNEGWQTRLAINTEAARAYMESQGTEAPVSLRGFLFSDSISAGEDVENIFIPYPRATTFTQWRYIPAGGKYLRFADDQPLSDANGLGQVAADNVIIYFAEHQKTDIVEDSNGATSIRILVNGTGPAWFFRDGKLNKGYWQTDGTRTPYFMYQDGSPYSLKPGNTWIEVVPTYFTIGLDDPGQASASP